MDNENLEVIYLSYFGSASPSYYGIRYQHALGSWLWEWPPPREKISRPEGREILAISVYNLQDVASPDDPLHFGRVHRSRKSATLFLFMI